MKTKNIFVIILCLVLFVSLSKAQTWKQTNGPFGGEVTNLAVHPNGDLYTAVKSQKGLFRSTNNGDSWNCIGFTDQIVDKIFIANSGYIFLQTIYPDGSFRSTDDGATWHQANLSPFTIGFEDDGIGNIYHTEQWNYWTVYRSSDGGDNWVLWTEYTKGLINDLLFYDNNNYIFRINGGNGIFRLINNDWVQYATIPYSCNITCIEVTSNGVLIVGLGTRYTQLKGIFRSLDNGITWQRVFSNNIENSDINRIVVNSAGIIFVGTSNGVFKSTDDGASWNQIGMQCSIISTLVHLNSSFVVTGSMYGGLSRWNDPENVWEDINLGLFVQATYSFDYDQTNQNYVAATSNGVFYTSNQGETWHHTFQTLLMPRSEIVIDGNPDFLYVNGIDFIMTGLENLLYRSSDRGITWESLYLPANIVTALMTTSLPGEIWCGSNSGSVHYSSDYGASWTEKYVVPSAVKCLKSGNIQGYMFAGTDGSGFYRSTNSGETWREFNIGLLNYSVESIAMNSTHDIFIGTHEGIYRSVDLAGNWQFVGFSQETVSAIAINSLDYLLAGTLSGHIYISTDNGENWNDYSSGLNTSTMFSIVLDENDFAMVGTASSGVYRSFNSTVDIRESDIINVTSFELFQNYPNPFNPSTRIKYSVPQTSKVQIKIYDILGNEIETLVNDEKQVGTYEITWNAASLPSGVYFYQLRAVDPSTGSRQVYVETKKMILLK